MTRTKAYRSALTKSMVLGFLLAALMALSLMPMAQPAHAQATFTVNSTSDPGGNGCHSTECTLREAITAANRTSSADVINFNILGGTDPTKTISPT
jgi:CSLREA domain-containing protein